MKDFLNFILNSKTGKFSLFVVSFLCLTIWIAILRGKYFEVFTMFSMIVGIIFNYYVLYKK